LLFYLGLGSFVSMVSWFLEFWSRTSNISDFLFRDDKLALMYDFIDVIAWIDAVTPLSKIRVLWRA
jgi:hypothetical protein